MIEASYTPASLMAQFAELQISPKRAVFSAGANVTDEILCDFDLISSWLNKPNGGTGGSSRATSFCKQNGKTQIRFHYQLIKKPILQNGGSSPKPDWKEKLIFRNVRSKNPRK